MPKLQVSLPDGSEVSHDLGEAEITVGRISDNTLQIDDGSVSSRHAVLIQDGETYILRDIGSTNGTRLNGTELEPEADHKLGDGDRIRFGSIETVFHSEARSEARPLPAEEAIAAVPAATSVRPSSFANASPFQKKSKKKSPAAMAILAFSIVSLLIFGAAIASILQMKSPL